MTLLEFFLGPNSSNPATEAPLQSPVSPDSSCSTMTEKETHDLIALSRRLKALTAEIKLLAASENARLKTKQDAPNDCMSHFQLRGHISFEARKGNPYYLFDEPDYLLKVSDLHLQQVRTPSSSWVGDLEFPHDCPDVLHGYFPSWLMHELYKSGPNAEPGLSPHECLSIDTIHVEIVTAQSYVYDLRSGKWIKDEPMPLDS